MIEHHTVKPYTTAQLRVSHDAPCEVGVLKITSNCTFQFNLALYGTLRVEAPAKPRLHVFYQTNTEDVHPDVPWMVEIYNPHSFDINITLKATP